MQLDSGKTDVVNLGPKEKFQGVDVREADDIRILATQGRINGQDALIAEEVSIDGETIKVMPNELRDRRWSSSDSNQNTRQTNREARRNSPWND